MGPEEHPRSGQGKAGPATEYDGRLGERLPHGAATVSERSAARDAQSLRSLEDAAQVIDSIAASRRAFITFGGPPRAMGHSVEDTGKKQRKRQAPPTAHDQERPKRAPASGVFISFAGPQGHGAVP
jgi:hypothetical protein